MFTTTNKKRALVIGAGPMGLETALRAIEKGFETIVLEAGQIGENIRRWGHIRMFSPFRMNLSPLARKYLPTDLSEDNLIQSGAEYVSTVLEPLTRSEILRDKIVTDRRVISIARSALGKAGLPGHPLRAERSFRILAEDRNGNEHVYQADLIFDASGVFTQPNWSGTAGMPAPGERAANARIIRHPIDVLRDENRFVGKRILVLGYGHSAANMIVALAKLTEEQPNTQVIWAVRSDRLRPVIEVPDDPLPERADIAEAANDLAQKPPQNWQILRRATIEKFKRSAKESITAVLKVWKNIEEIEVDEIISLTGYRPDLAMLRETTVQLSNVSEGTAGLYKALTNVTDCLAKIEVTPKDLHSGEPNLFIVGIKSYGRNSGFLLQSGVEQLDAIFESL